MPVSEALSQRCRQPSNATMFFSSGWSPGRRAYHPPMNSALSPFTRALFLACLDLIWGCTPVHSKKMERAFARAREILHMRGRQGEKLENFINIRKKTTWYKQLKDERKQWDAMFGILRTALIVDVDTERFRRTELAFAKMEELGVNLSDLDALVPVYLSILGSE